ncbi:MAG: VOC family protein, partial [Candidatus Heimdallarchaeota archaeon]
MSRIVHFAISAEDISRAKMFYENVFGWEVREFAKNFPLLIFPGKNNDLLLEKANNNNLTSIGIGSIQQRRYQENMAITISVSNIDESIEKIKVNGGQVLSPKFPLQGIGYMIICQDTEGNALQII